MRFFFVFPWPSCGGSGPLSRFLEPTTAINATIGALTSTVAISLAMSVTTRTASAAASTNASPISMAVTTHTISCLHVRSCSLLFEHSYGCSCYERSCKCDLAVSVPWVCSLSVDLLVPLLILPLPPSSLPLISYSRFAHRPPHLPLTSSSTSSSCSTSYCTCTYTCTATSTLISTLFLYSRILPWCLPLPLPLPSASLFSLTSAIYIYPYFQLCFNIYSCMSSGPLPLSTSPPAPALASASTPQPLPLPSILPRRPTSTYTHIPPPLPVPLR